MILPIGHEESAVRRLPWVTFAIMAACVLVLLGTNTRSTDAALATPAERLEQAADYWRQHAYLEADPEIREHVAYDVMPNQRSQYLFLLEDSARSRMPKAPDEVAAQQRELDRLSALAKGGVQPGGEAAESPYERWGLVPNEQRPVTFLTHIFVHAGWLHLLSNLFMLFLAGPAVEDRYGRPLFAGLFLFSGVFAGLVWCTTTGNSYVPMVGASGAIAGVLGAFLVRFFRTKIRFAYFFIIMLRIFRGTFQAPAWAMLPLWFANELFSAWLADEMGMQGGVAYWAHVGGFAGGLGFALLVRTWRVEERFIHQAIERKVTIAAGNPVVAEALRLREAGDDEGSFALLAEEIQRSADDPDVCVAYWDACVARQDPERAAPTLCRAIERMAASGQAVAAANAWCELTSLLPEAPVNAATLVRLHGVLREQELHTEAATALARAVAPGATGMKPALALRILRLAEERMPAVAAAAARLALEAPEMATEKRCQIEATLRRLEERVGREEGARMAEARDTGLSAVDPTRAIEVDLRDEGQAESAAAFEPTALDSPADRLSELDPEVALDASLPRFREVKCMEASPEALGSQALRLKREGGASLELPYERIQAVAAAVVERQSEKPVVVIDLLLDWRSVESEVLHAVRLRSNRFTPKRLVPEAERPIDALSRFIACVVERSGATALPDRESACGRPFRRYADLETYQRELLEVA